MLRSADESYGGFKMLITVTKGTKIDKRCSCGKLHTIVPEAVDLQMDYDGKLVAGYIWNCTCGSTVFVAIQREEVL